MNAQPNPYAEWEENFVAHMRRLRESADMTQTDLARVLKARYALPFHQQTIQRIEAGQRPVRLDEAFLIADAFDVDLETMTANVPSSDRDLLYAVDRVHSRARGLRSGLEELMLEWSDVVVGLVVELEDRLGKADGPTDEPTRLAMAFAVKAHMTYSSMQTAARGAALLAGEEPTPNSGLLDVTYEWSRMEGVDEAIEESASNVYIEFQEATRSQADQST